MTLPQTPATPPSTQPVWPGHVAPPRGNGLAITAIVLSTCALVGVLLVGVLGAVLFFAGGGSFDTYTLQGRAETSQGQVAARDLELAVREVIEEDGGNVSTVECPEDAKVASGLSVMCDATIDDVGWVAVVVFENDQGDFALVVH